MKIKNTEREGALDMLFEAMIAGTAGGTIERSEARGQQEAINSQQLPTDGLEKVASELGITVHSMTEGDELFSDVTLPDGWSKRATDHAMWNDVVDESGAIRAVFFYKAAFYDRNAHIRIYTK
jgi:hypothetical protein